MLFFLTSLAAIFIILPVLFYALVFYSTKYWSKNNRKAKSVAINITTFILIFSVHYLILTIWSKSLLWMIILFILLTAIVFTFVYWKTKEEIHYRKVFQGFWRLNFLLFSAIYICLLIYGAASRAVEAIMFG
ncbi:DUF3397 domain-containing protein [Lederbergia wuyishanensis]|uniref:Membrane protein n=1 Tax=Lederbergia wuyishanensis TaxID=1347903 RepID=A0ABU0CZH1_9BACI|nr:DUF3397 domain-containing protein [Lederbergia wuyishanensis]MCJ8006168.1 DUF3397 domain-containing protein [Lederbergia wuyishanensis]MDQ0341538.1 putative membrane protein [Lederbergia wuyishanensis]